MTRQDPEHLYHWRGRNAMGQSVQGQMAAYHPQDLQHRLQAQRVRLLHCHRAADRQVRLLRRHAGSHAETQQRRRQDRHRP
mgnify:CR=1 FL=1